VSFVGSLLTNQELIERFESDTLPGEFHHAEHVRLAFAYLSECPVVEALDRFVSALKRFAMLRGKPERYHETITFAYFFLIQERMVRMPDLEWDEFARQNADLLEWKPGVLGRYYRGATLGSDLARRVFVFPDLCGSRDGEHLSG
jgi:hypothetical protein